MMLDIQTLLPNLEALTPEGRWNALQSWLKENPEYGERVEEWSTQTVDQVFGDLLVLVTKRHGAVAAIVFSMPTIATKIRSAIESLQVCYRERLAEDKPEKEITHGNQRRSTTVPRRSGKNPKRTSTRAKRTDQG